MSENSDLDKKRLILDAINIELNSYIPWVSRKEIASWTAIAFYIAIVLSFTGFLYNNFSEYKSFSVPTILPISIFIVIIFSITIALFIHSQFSAIYDKEILKMILRKNIYKVIDSDDINSLNMEFKFDKNDEEYSLPHFIFSEFNSYRTEHPRPSPKKKVINVWMWVIIWFFTKNKTEDDTKDITNDRKISLHQKQEALLYSMIIIFLCIFIGSVFYIAYCT